MSRTVIFCAGLFAVLLSVIAWRIRESARSPEVLFEARSNPPQAAPLCPWRDPEHDLKLFFPDATTHELQTRILSGQRLEIAHRLGRAPTGDDNVLNIHRIYSEKTRLGAVLTRRVKGAYGAIELVLAVSTNGQTRGLHLQRLREPEPIAFALQNPDWLAALVNRQADSTWQLGHDLPDVPADARSSAEAVLEGIRTLLILLAVAEETNSPSPLAASHH